MLRINGKVCLLKYEDKDFTVSFKDENKTKFAYITIRRMI